MSCSNYEDGDRLPKVLSKYISNGGRDREDHEPDGKIRLMSERALKAEEEDKLFE